jgi:membrane peptidoglycan carboxypeptidase
VLQGVLTNGTASANGPIGRPAAGKAGTTDNFDGAFFVGYVPQMAAAVWVGDSRNPVNFPLDVTSTTPEGVPVPNWPASQAVFGGDLPTKIWHLLMINALANVPVVDLPPAIGDPGTTNPLNPTPAPPPPPPPPAPTSTAPKPSTKPTTKPTTTKPTVKPTRPTTKTTPGTGAHNTPGAR